jgi:enoyl-CoA hydratase/carnithine racemase
MSQRRLPPPWTVEGCGSRQSRWQQDAADGFAVLVRLLSEARCLTAASRRLWLSSRALILRRATGVGSELALACDMRFASREKAILSQFEVGAGT